MGLFSRKKKNQENDEEEFFKVDYKNFKTAILGAISVGSEDSKNVDITLEDGRTATLFFVKGKFKYAFSKDFPLRLAERLFWVDEQELAVDTCEKVATIANGEYGPEIYSRIIEEIPEAKNVVEKILKDYSLSVVAMIHDEKFVNVSADFLFNPIAKVSKSIDFIDMSVDELDDEAVRITDTAATLKAGITKNDYQDVKLVLSEEEDGSSDTERLLVAAAANNINLEQVREASSGFLWCDVLRSLRELLWAERIKLDEPEVGAIIDEALPDFDIITDKKEEKPEEEEKEQEELSENDFTEDQEDDTENSDPVENTVDDFEETVETPAEEPEDFEEESSEEDSDELIDMADSTFEENTDEDSDESVEVEEDSEDEDSDEETLDLLNETDDSDEEDDSEGFALDFSEDSQDDTVSDEEPAEEETDSNVSAFGENDFDFHELDRDVKNEETSPWRTGAMDLDLKEAVINFLNRNSVQVQIDKHLRTLVNHNEALEHEVLAIEARIEPARFEYFEKVGNLSNLSANRAIDELLSSEDVDVPRAEGYEEAELKSNGAFFALEDLEGDRFRVNKSRTEIFFEILDITKTLRESFGALKESFNDDLDEINLIVKKKLDGLEEAEDKAFHNPKKDNKALEEVAIKKDIETYSEKDTPLFFRLSQKYSNDLDD